MMPSDNKHPVERGVLEILRDVRSGAISGSSLSIDERRHCVEHLSAEGLGATEIASMLGVSDRTVQRDRSEIHKRNALEHDTALPGQIAGRLMAEVTGAMERMRRVGRDRDCPHSTRVEAERASIEVLDKAVERLQRLGFLPSVGPSTLNTLRFENADAMSTLNSLDAIQAEAARLLSLSPPATETPPPPAPPPESHPSPAPAPASPPPSESPTIPPSASTKAGGDPSSGATP
jgi:transposase